MASLHLQAHNYRAVGPAGGRFLLHVPTTAMFELDRAADALLELVEARGEIGEAEVRTRFDGVFAPGEICDALADFLTLGIVTPARKDYAPAPRDIDRAPIRSLVLTLTTGCNLGCAYCYREDLTSPLAATVMDEATARAAIDLLLRESDCHDRVSIIFFGGEPLTRFASIQALVAYAEARAAAAGKGIDFALTTNATLLDDAMIEFFEAHRFGISVSIDGDAVAHDRRRLTLGGKGSYRTVAEKSARLLAGLRARPVGARVTLTSGNTDVARIFTHLKDEIGFAEVGFAPVTAGPDSPLGLDAGEMRTVLEAMKGLGRAAVRAAKRGASHGFSNFEQMLQDLWNGTRKTLPCGAGIGLLAVGAGGDLALCHRFTGTGVGTFGDVHGGIAQAQLGAFLRRAQELHPDCRNCRARSLCAGGCYHEAYARHGDPLSPTFGHCDFVREWLDFGIACCGEIVLANPSYFSARSGAAVPRH